MLHFTLLNLDSVLLQQTSGYFEPGTPAIISNSGLRYVVFQIENGCRGKAFSSISLQMNLIAS